MNALVLSVAKIIGTGHNPATATALIAPAAETIRLVFVVFGVPFAHKCFSPGPPTQRN